jgi:hypothetical protein
MSAMSPRKSIWSRKYAGIRDNTLYLAKVIGKTDIKSALATGFVHFSARPIYISILQNVFIVKVIEFP